MIREDFLEKEEILKQELTSGLTSLGDKGMDLFRKQEVSNIVLHSFLL